jgi:hypothetical protein
VCSSRRSRAAERDEEEQQEEEEVKVEVEDDVRGNIGNVSDAGSVVDDEGNYGATMMRLPHGEVVTDFVTREDVDPDSSGYRKNWPVCVFLDLESFVRELVLSEMEVRHAREL